MEDSKRSLERMWLDVKLGKIEKLLSDFSGDNELSEKLKEVKMILVDRINSYENED
jgi:hypothetical protein